MLLSRLSFCELHIFTILCPRSLISSSLSWADTAASTTGRLYGHLTAPLPAHLLGFPVATRKSLAGVAGSFIIGTLTTLVFWGFCTNGMGGELGQPVWQWYQPQNGGWLGLLVLSVGAGMIASGVEVLGAHDC